MRVQTITTAAALFLAACAHDDAKPTAPAPTVGERVDATRKGLGEAAVTPLEDVGLIRPDIPKTLAGITYPYSVASLGGSCAEVSYQLGQLDAALGVESYQPKAKESLAVKGADAAQDATVDVAQGAAESVIPFRGWIRRASGADAAARKAARAVELGQTRRAFLRGYGAALGCPGMIPPPPAPERGTGAAVIRK